ncbi:MAG: FecR domain-containing protein [Opitutaceae bacterium]|nr:FecR domain-containing protein [Opitutaceae bacterium]
MIPSDSNRASLHESIEARAAAWLAQQDDGLTEAEIRVFAAWRAEDPRHEAAVTRLEQAWETMQQLRNFRPDAAQHPDRDLLAPEKIENMISFPVRPVLAAAAAIAVMAAAMFFGILSPPPPDHPAPAPLVAADYYATTAGGYQRATLPDGSVVELNEQSEMNLRFTKGERRVVLRKGEIHFTVTKNRERPFIVEANGVNVRAIGTAFNVRMMTDVIEVLVTEGVVSLDNPRNESPGATTEPPMINAGDRAVVDLNSATSRLWIEHLTEAAIDEALSWQGSWLVFVDTPLSEVVSQFNGRNKVQITIEDAELGNSLVRGNFHAENIEGLVRLMASDEDILVVRPSPDQVIIRRAR